MGMWSSERFALHEQSAREVQPLSVSEDLKRLDRGYPPLNHGTDFKFFSLVIVVYQFVNLPVVRRADSESDDGEVPMFWLLCYLHGPHAIRPGCWNQRESAVRLCRGTN